MTKIAFLFPGQGAQAVGMGQQLAETLPAARELYERANFVLNYDLAQLCFEGPAEKLDATEHSQPALFVTSMAALEALRREAPAAVESCQIAAGLSLGEYTALTFAGAIDFEDALKVVRIRGQAMQKAADATPSGMVSILGLETEQVAALCDQVRQDGETLQIANLLCPGNTVISGDRSACERAAEAAPAAGAMKAVPLAVAGAFHTPIMQSAVQQLATALAEITIKRPSLGVVSNVDAQVHDDPDEIRRLLVDQLVSPVLWENSLRLLIGEGCNEYYEVGPGRVLRGLLRRVDRKLTCHTVMN